MYANYLWYTVMAAVWRIEGSDGFTADLPGYLHPSEVIRVLQRLTCYHLSRDEIVNASRRKGSADYSPLLERIGVGEPIHFGQDPFYTARQIEI